MALDPSRTIARQGLTGLVLVAAICLPLIALMVQDVVRELRLLRSASTDNQQWTLSQVEIEFQEFRRSAERVAHGSASDLEILRADFDIFYSRIGTLEASGAFARLRENDEFDAALTTLRGFLDASVPLIDGPDPALRDEVRRWEPQLAELREATRDLSISGLTFFASASEARRDRIALTLRRVALLTTALLLAMAATLIILRRTTTRLQEHGRLLGATNARLNTILDTTRDGIVVADRHGRILQFNAAAEAMFGRKASEVAGLRFSRFIRCIEAKSDPVRLESLNGQGRWTMEGLRKDGSTFPIEIAVSCASAGGEDIFIGSVRDVSHSMAAERDLLAAHDRAVAGEKAKSDFLAVMTHEIRTPLNGLLGNLNLMQDTDLSEDQSRFTRNMAISGEVLMRHVDSVMDIARLESQTPPNAREPVHLGRLLQDVVDGQSGAAVARGTTLTWRWIGMAAGWVASDPVRLHQILLNLVGNAIKFTEAGAIIIEAEAETDRGDPGKLTLELRVIDTGIGIAEDALDTVFDDFTTLDTSYRRKTGGTGLGLGIARRLTESLGGEIGAESTLGEGSVFWVRLPLARTAAPAKSIRQTEEATETKPLDILVVEDNEINQDLALDQLRALGHRALAASDGRAGVAMAEAQAFDAILMDISMPVMDGLEAARHIRASNGPCANVPIIALSANVLARKQERFEAAGMNDFLGKPFTRAALQATLERATSHPVPAPQADDSPGARRPSDAVVARLRATFSKEVADLIDWLSEADIDTPEIEERCHRIAGTAAAFEETGLRDALIAIEDAAEARDAPTFQQRVADLGKLDPRRGDAPCKRAV